MPYKSDAQRKYMHAKLPALAARWDRKYGADVLAKKQPKKKRKRKGS